ncbi:MAG TPA: hypothetical protein VFE24_03620 [Pirellulales bacterium]|jgi:YHS domain-containing protein|nr:hypothetical protein [Pirellulales bacterium]
MKTRILGSLCFVALMCVAFVYAEDKVAQLKCPVSGKPASPDHVVSFNGGKVEFCCDNCPKAFEKDTAKYAGKANLQLVQSGQLKQVACPITGKPVDASKTVTIDGVKVAFCCDNCKGKVEKATGDEKIDLVFKDTSKGFKPAK